MPAAVVAATFEDVGKALKIGVDIGMRIDERISNTGLRSQMNDIRKAMLLE